MVIKNTTSSDIFINKSVQIDVDTTDQNDGVVLPYQILDLSKSLTNNEIANDQILKASVYSGDIIFVVDGIELDKNHSIEVYDYGPTQWAKIFNPVISKHNLYEGLASGFLYVKNCLIG